MKIIGITGGIGSGKTIVTDLLRKLDACVVCADELTHKLYEPGDIGSNAISNEFGIEFLSDDGSVDRKKLGHLVFNDKVKLERLNELIHPLIFYEINRTIDEKNDLLFIDAAVLIESGLYKSVDSIWLVETDEDIKINRLMLRDNMDKAQIMKRMNFQMSDEEKTLFANEVIDNSFSIADTYVQVFKLYLKEIMLLRK